MPLKNTFLNLVPEKVIDNFWLRNVCMLSILSSIGVLQHLAFSFSDFRGLAKFSLLYLTLYLVYILHNRILYPRFLSKKKWLSYSILVLSIVIINLAVNNLITAALFNTEVDWLQTRWWIMATWFDAITIYVAFAVYMSFSWYKERRDLLRAELYKKEASLRQLEEVLTPTFLTNALTNIYNYSLLHNYSSGNLILKMSEVLRKLLYASDKNYIALEEEICLVESYLEFEKERNGCEIRFDKKLAVENTFIGRLVLFSIVDITLQNIANILQLTITLVCNTSQISMVITNSSGCKNSNHNILFGQLTHRLDALYRGRFSLETYCSEDYLETNFCLKLTDDEWGYRKDTQ